MTRSVVYGPSVTLDAGGNKWTNLADGVAASDAATVGQIAGGSGVTYGTPAVVLGTSAAAGSTDEAIRRDSTIVAFDTTVPVTQAFGDSAATGSATVAARRDHKHAMPATPTTVSGNAGTATALQTARAIDGQNFDGTAAITVIAPGTHAATSKTTPVDADELPLVDSAASNVLKKLTWANLKATLKTYFDTLYPSGSGTAYVVGGTDVAVADGGTGASVAATARSNLGIPAAVGGVEWTVVTKAGDTSRNTTTVLAADPELTFTPASGGVYEVELFLVYASATGAGTPDLKCIFAEDATARGAWSAGGFFNISDAGSAIGTTLLAQTSTFFSPGTAATNRAFILRGWYVGTGNAAALYWSQNTSDSHDTTVKTGSILRYRKVV